MKGAFANTGLVYSTDAGRMCPHCRQPTPACTCKSLRLTPTGDGVVRVSRQTKGRAGKGVTLVKGLALAPTALNELGKLLRTQCGAGGTVKDGQIEVQGDHAERIVQVLKDRGFAAKLSGGQG